MKKFNQFLIDVKNKGYDMEFAELVATNTLFQEGSTLYEFPKNLPEQTILNSLVDSSMLQADFNWMIDCLLNIYDNEEELTYAMALYFVIRGDIYKIKESKKSHVNKVKSLVSRIKGVCRNDDELSLEVLGLALMWKV